jgi:hemerythrin-like domain-containing protein
VDPQRLASRVRREHGAIRTLLDGVERACALANDGSSGSATRLRQAVWDLYLVFDEHLAMEEAHVAPLLRAFDVTGEQRAVEMVLEHNEQRRLILELVEDAERHATALAGLVKAAISLVQAFRTDMETEESALAVVFLAGG